MYKENPKTRGSGIICSIPQKGLCPNKCLDCFFQSGRSYLEPLNENLPNVPGIDLPHQVVRINDGNDSNIKKDIVISNGEFYRNSFYNTAIPNLDFPGPVVLTLNPAKMTDNDFHKVDNPPKNLMFVRFRTNTWNLKLFREAVFYYAERQVPIVATFMAYFDSRVPEDHQKNYIFSKRTLNSYWVIKTDVWRTVMDYWRNSPSEKWVYSCSKIEGERGERSCRFCGNCLREYHATMERMYSIRKTT